MKIRFSLRSLALAVAGIAIVCALIRLAYTTVPSVLINAKQDGCVVYLDDTALGEGRFTISVERATALGIPLRGPLRCEPTSYGVYLLDVKNKDGFPALLHLRPRAPEACQALPTIQLNGPQRRHIVLLDWPRVGDDRHFFLRAASPDSITKEANMVVCEGDTSDGLTRTYSLKVNLPPSILKACAPKGSGQFSLNAYSLDDGRYSYRLVNLAANENGMRETIEWELPLRHRNEHFFIYYVLQTPNNLPGRAPFGEALYIRRSPNYAENEQERLPD